ncbi:MAG TPA: cupin domain-containing protein, partial [Thermomicrobiales bacterium]|nr:cupin domain-containing protein [Thermomicrobiales bacterium]
REHYRLQVGDALCFRSTQPHRWWNDGGTPTAVLWINVPMVAPGPDRQAGRVAARERGDGQSQEG